MFTPARFADGLAALLATLPQTASAADPPKLCVALSGGLDSTVLLVALAQLRDEGRLQAQVRAVHVDHGLHADSLLWAQACHTLALEHRIELRTDRVAIDGTAGLSPEAAAREARYAALAARLEAGEVLLTAHHADDQLETILLQWLRGGGLRAIAGMAPLGRFGATAWHARPLLEFSRDELARWATAQGLRWQEDPSNADLRFDRNYLRHAVLPALRARWPGAAMTAGRVAEFARDALAAEATSTADDLPRVLAGCALDLPALQSLPDARQRAVLRAWLAGLGLPAPTARTLAALRRDITVAAPDRLPATQWPGAIVRRYRGRLYAADATSPAIHEGGWAPHSGAPYAWSATSRLDLVEDVGVGLSQARLAASLTVRRRTGGEAFLPAGGAHRRPLRKWLQERDVLPWRREELPLLFVGDRLVAVADLGIGADFAAVPGEPSWRIAWTGRGTVTGADVIASKWPLRPAFR